MIFVAEALRTIRAITDAGPEGHIDKNAVKLVVPHQFTQAGKGMLTIGGVRANSAGATEHLAVISLFGQEPPLRMILIGPVIEDDAVIRRKVEIVALAFRHNLSEVITPTHAGVHLAKFRAPQAEAHV